MSISDICIRRPVFATVLSLVLILVGFVSYERLTIREYPSIDSAVISVITDYRGASPEIIETQVTQVLEDSLAGIEGIDYMRSSSRPERSLITIVFRLDRDADGAAADVRDRLGRVRGKLPDDVDEPVIRKVEADAQAIINLALTSDRHSQLELSDFADRYVRERLQTLPGVADISLNGERRYSMRLWLDPLKLAAYGMTPLDVESALRAQNLEVPGGRIESAEREFTVLSRTDLRSPQAFENLVLANIKGYIVRLSDVGRAEIGAADERRINRYNGQPAQVLGVVKQATANPLQVTEAVRAELPHILSSLPEGMHLAVGYDKSIFIKESIKNVYHTIGEAVVLVVLIIFFFLRSVRAVLIPVVTIPVALIGACALMYAMNFSINTLTLLAMVLAIGLVVDDAIVMLENIYRHVESGMHPMRAAFVGAREIGFAVIAMTLTLVAVYAPIGFLTGTTGRLFTEFAWTLAGAVLVSGFVALTLTPMMCSRLLRHHERHGRLYEMSERGFRGMTAGYRALLSGALSVRPLVLLIGLAVAGASGWLYVNLKAELAPLEDQGTIVSSFTAPDGATVDYTFRYAERIEELVRAVPEVQSTFAVVGFPQVTQGLVIGRMTDWNARNRKQQDIVRELGPKIFAVPGVLAFPSNPPPLGQRLTAKPIQVVLQTSEPYEQLDRYARDFIEAMSANEGIRNLDSDLRLRSPQLAVRVDRDKLADLGVPVDRVGRTLETLLGGRVVTNFKLNGKQYDTIVQIEPGNRQAPHDMARIHVRSRAGEMVPLSNLVNVSETVAPKELIHFNQLRAATISGTLSPDYTLGEALTAMADTAREVLPSSVRLDYSGESREFRTASSSTTLIFALALAFIFLVLAAQFESFVDPVIIMITVPLSITGALAALYFTGGTLNIYSQVGLVTLIGLITKHGILIVEFANQLQRRGLPVREAVTESATLRLRPILMTTGAMVLGALPLALAEGAGAESRRQIGWVVVGGLLVGTLFTLFVIPTVYSLIGRKRPIDTSHEVDLHPVGATGMALGPGAPRPAE